MYHQKSSYSQEILTPTTTSVLIIPDSEQHRKIKSSCSAKACVCHTFTARKPRALRSWQGHRTIGSSLSHLPSPQSRGHLPFFNNYLFFFFFKVLQHWTIVITLFLGSSVCLITAEYCHLFVFSTHDRPLCSSPWDSQPSAVPIQMGIKVQFYFTVLSSLQQIFSDSVFWLLNCSVLSDWSKTSVCEIKRNVEGILQLCSEGVEDFEHQTSKQQEETQANACTAPCGFWGVHLSPESFANCHIIQEVMLQNI